MPRPKNAVLIVTAAEGFKPQQPQDLPASIERAELYARNLSGSQAAGFCHTFNKSQIAAGLPDRKWAIRIACTRAHWLGVPGDRHGRGRPAGVDQAAEILGHASPEVTARHYAEPAEDLDPADAPHAAEKIIGHASPDVTAGHYDERTRTRRVDVDAPELLRVFAACELIDSPRIEGIATADWWRALLLVLNETGLRLAEVLAIETADMDWAGGPSRLAIQKPLGNGGALLLQFSRAAMHALQRIKGDRKLLFPCPGGQAQLRRAFQELQELAGVPADRRFTLHDLRRAAITSIVRAEKGGAV